jgi:hypothetical protein
MYFSKYFLHFFSNLENFQFEQLDFDEQIKQDKTFFLMVFGKTAGYLLVFQTHRTPNPIISYLRLLHPSVKNLAHAST